MTARRRVDDHAAAEARPRVIACLDGSAYANSVCDHAAWLAGSVAGTPQLLHALEDAEHATRALHIVEAGEARLRENGVAAGQTLVLSGPFAAVAAAETSGTDVLVLGKRGESPERGRRTLGAQAFALLRRAQAPLLLVSKVHLPATRALVLIDSDPRHRRAAEFASAHPALTGLETDVIQMQPIGIDAEPKLTWARGLLNGLAEVYPMSHGTPDIAASRFIADHGVDLVVVSREMLFEQERALGLSLQRRGLWGLRTPVFIC